MGRPGTPPILGLGVSVGLRWFGRKIDQPPLAKYQAQLSLASVRSLPMRTKGGLRLAKCLKGLALPTGFEPVY